MAPAADGLRTVRQRIAALSLPVAAVTGLGIAWLDTRPGNDATGVTAGLLLIAAFASAVLDARRAWLVALFVGVPVPLAAFLSGSPAWPGALLALLFAAAGAVAGWSLGRRRTAG